MSELASIAEEVNASISTNTTCPICSQDAGNIKKLKTHILLKHPKQNLCLFCIEKKGWSDTFASQSSYNQHYKDYHEGIIEKKEKIREEDKQWKKQERARVNAIAQSLGQPPPKRLRKRLLCTHCDPRIEFEAAEAFDRHFIAEHNYDYCSICNIIGPIALIRLHILEKHCNAQQGSSNKLCCYICCGSGPIFNQVSKLNLHLVTKHDLKSMHLEESDELQVSEYLCFNCDDSRQNAKFPTILSLSEHLKFKHEPVNQKETLKSMQKRNRSSSEVINKPRHKVIGLKNTSGQDCFSISVLHLLAQMDLFRDLKPLKKHAKCTKAYCLMVNFMNEYSNGQRYQLEPLSIVKNYASFGLDSIHDTIDVGDFLRGALFEIGSDASNDEHYKDTSVRNMTFVHLEWKFECEKCQRFLTMNVKDYVLKLKISEEKSLEKILEDFFFKKKCPCGKICCHLKPNVKSKGKYVFLEIDRTVSTVSSDPMDSKLVDESSKEIRLFSLKLKPQYKLFEEDYKVIGTINYMLDNEDGGHYVTYLFPTFDEYLKVHELETKYLQWRKPDFDTETVIVALEKLQGIFHF